METGMPGLASAPVHINSTAAQAEKRTDIQAPLMAVYIPAVPALPAQPHSLPPAPARESATLHLAVPPLYSMETLPFLTLHMAGGLQSHAGLSLAAVSPSARVKSAGKHVCPHCGRDCMKPSVLEKHLRCHTGERPYPCTTCGISFKTQSNLYKHKRTQAHARLSSESDQSCPGSLDSMSCSRETFPSSLSLEESGSMENDTTLPTLETTSPTRTGKVFSVRKHVSVCQQSELNPADHETKEPNESAKVTIEAEKRRMENKTMLPKASRHLPLQRQEATLFSKQWESSASKGKPQSHESTDSGFSESSDHHPSPGSFLTEHSMDSHTESTKEHLQQITNTQTSSELGRAGQEAKHTAREQEQKTLEERISKLISENTAVVEDKQLENVRPRKTVLSKQGSIDLPMPYTYKDSFHFDMRISQTQNVGLQRNRMAGFYSSVPTQQSTTTEHDSLVRSSSLPFSVSLSQPDRRSTPTASHQSDYLTLIRTRSSGQINPTGSTSKSVNQQTSTHRPLVRQIAVDCNHATDSPYSSSVEEACAASRSCDRDNGDNCGEPSNRKFRRKKTQKFAYNKWYIYGDGTFKKLYNAEKGGDDSVIKGRKCLTNPDHKVVQGSQKRLSEDHKQTVATTGSAVNFTGRVARVCHPECPPVKQSHVSAVDYNPKTGHLPTSFGSLTPLRRNLSPSVLPLPPIASLVNHKTVSLIRAEDDILINSQLCESHIPSDRKKQKTGDKIFPMETDPSTLTHPPPSVAGGAPQQTSNPSYINLQDNVKHSQLKGVLFPPSMINANTTSFSTSPATPTPSATKTSFLPKYQLKLPNAAQPVSNALPQAGDKSSVTDCCNISSAPPVSSLMQSCDVKKANVFSSTQSQLLLPCTATTFCQAESSSLDTNAKSSLVVVHRQFAAATITTSCIQDYQAGLCSSSIQPTKSTGGSVTVQLTRPSAPVAADFPATPTITTANNQTSAATITAFSQGQPNHPLSHTQPASDQSNPVNRPYASSNTPTVPCQIVPFDQMQPAAQNVFHVHTADLQICLQIISDEQLALIEPQIERQAGGTLSQRRDTEAAVQRAQSFEVHSQVKDHQHSGHQKEPDQSESLVTLNMDRIKPQLSEQFGEVESNLQMGQHSHFIQSRVSPDSKPPETQGLLQRPQNYGNENMVTETQNVTTSVVPPVASLKRERSGRSQTSEERHVLSLNRCAEEELLPDSRVSQGGGFTSQPVSGQPKLNVTCLSSSTVNQDSMRAEILENENQYKIQNQASTTKAKGETSVFNMSKLGSGETHSSPQDRLGRTSGASWADELSGSVPSYSINRCKAPGQLKPQASIHGRNPVESTSSGTLNSSQRAEVRCDFESPMSKSTAPLQEITLSESEDVISSAPSEKQPGQFTSVSSNIQVERPQDIPAVLTDIESATAGLLEACAALKDPQTQGRVGTSGDWSPAQTRHQQWVESEGDGGMAGVDENRGLKTDKEPGQRGQAELTCRYTFLQEVTKPERKENQAKMDSLKTLRLSEQHLSTTQSGMYPQQIPQQTPNTSDDLKSPGSSSQNSFFHSPQPSLETNNCCFSQHCRESTIGHDLQQQKLCDRYNETQAQSTGTQNTASSQIDSSPQKIFSNQDQQQGSITLRVQRRNTTSTVSCATAKLASGSHIITSPDIQPSSSTNPGRVSCSVDDTAGSTSDLQAPNSNMLDNNTLLPSRPFTYPEMADYQDTKDKAPNEHASHGGNFGRSDISNKYQSLFFSGQLHGQPAVECLSGGVKPVQSCQDYTGDTSSSDDEGKLIIEL